MSRISYQASNEVQIYSKVGTQELGPFMESSGFLYGLAAVKLSGSLLIIHHPHIVTSVDLRGVLRTFQRNGMHL